MRLMVSTAVPARQLAAVSGEPVHIPDPDGLVHVQFRRFAGCPVCDLHLRGFAARNADVLAAGIREVVVFHAPDAELRRHVQGLPFAVVADPGKQLYAAFGVESAKRALLDPRAWPAIGAGVLRSLWGIAAHRRPAPALRPHGGRFGLPADFLIGPDGRVLAVKYGQHANDHWPVGELLDIARRAREAATVPGQQADRSKALATGSLSGSTQSGTP